MTLQPTPERALSRRVHHADAIAWLRAQGTLPATSVITSLPDRSEIPTLDFESWRTWFEQAAECVGRCIAPGALAIFFQTDVRHEGVWVDKAALVARGAERAGLQLLLHGIVCRAAAGSRCYGQRGYSHLLAYAVPPHGLTVPHGWVDVLPDAGPAPSTKSMGVHACVHACNLIRALTPEHAVLDPFCGHGTVLAVANSLGLDAIGVDISRRMCQRARRLQLPLEARSARVGGEPVGVDHGPPSR